MLRSEIRGEEYRARARQARALAETAVLAQVRRRHEAAAATWQELAEREERQSVLSLAATARAPQRARAPKAAPADDIAECRDLAEAAACDEPR